MLAKRSQDPLWSPHTLLSKSSGHCSNIPQPEPWAFKPMNVHQRLWASHGLSPDTWFPGLGASWGNWHASVVLEHYARGCLNLRSNTSGLGELVETCIVYEWSKQGSPAGTRAAFVFFQFVDMCARAFATSLEQHKFVNFESFVEGELLLRNIEIYKQEYWQRDVTTRLWTALEVQRLL